MRRGKTQAIFRYLPDSVVDHTDTRTIGKVSSWRVREVKNVNKKRLADKIDEKLDQFDNSWSSFESIGQNNIAILEPVEIEVDLFPLTFTCRKCSCAFSFNSIKELRDKIGHKNYQCPKDKCNGTLDQIDLVHYHKCGKVESIAIKPCSKHGKQAVVLDKKGSGSISKWRWKCKICGNETGRIGKKCKCGNGYMKTAPFRKSDVFYPQSITMINVSDLETNTVEKKLHTAAYLGIINYEDIQNLRKTAQEDQISKDRQEELEELKEEGVPQEHIEKIKKKFDIGNEKTRKSVLDKLSRYINLSEEKFGVSSDMISDFVSTKNLDQVYSLEDIEKNAREINHPSKGIISEYKDKFYEIGISEAYMIGDFPIVQASFGYTRGSADPSECQLQFFPRLKDKYPGKKPVYGVSTETESILLEFDRNQILKWLDKNNMAEDIPLNADSIEQKSWFINNIDPDVIPVYDEIDPAHNVTKNIYTLIHSISHSLLSYAASLIGMDKNSLSEMIFPNIPAVVIYCNQTTEYQLGGMFTLMESNVISWVDSTIDGIERCIYDPVCIDSEGSCHGCLQTSEITCSHFNRDLNRDFLIGHSDKLNGFWENLY